MHRIVLADMRARLAPRTRASLATYTIIR